MRWLKTPACVLLLSCSGSASSGDVSSRRSSDAVSQVHQAAAAVTDSTSIAGFRLQLRQQDGTCALAYSGRLQGQIDILPKPPCYFLRRQTEHPQSFSYPDVDIKAVLIIAGTPLTDEARRGWRLPPDLVCGEETQAVFVRDSSVGVSRTVHRGGVACRDKGVDEKEFWAFVHDSA